MCFTSQWVEFRLEKHEPAVSARTWTFGFQMFPVAKRTGPFSLLEGDGPTNGFWGRFSFFQGVFLGSPFFDTHLVGAQIFCMVQATQPVSEGTPFDSFGHSMLQLRIPTQIPLQA